MNVNVSKDLPNPMIDIGMMCSQNEGVSLIILDHGVILYGGHRECSEALD